MQKIIFFFEIAILVLFFIPSIIAYSVEPNEEVHQHISKEARDIWPLIPYEILDHSDNIIETDTNPIFPDLDDLLFNQGEDVIDGSAEEDAPAYLNSPYHFWQPDDPNTLSIRGNDDYNDGFRIFGSSYRKALEYWNNQMIPAYLRGDVDEAYYWLGRVAHLLEDAAQPSHVHLDSHTGYLFDGTSILEDYTADNFNELRTRYSWDGSNFKGNQYNYEDLIDNFDWSTVEPTRIPDKNHIELFRLFWYTAQKTQYWASDDRDGNREYVDLDGNTIYWDCGDSGGDFDLWEDEGLGCGDMVIYEGDLDETTVNDEADAVIPHAMKATAGLYKLFWDAVHIDWPTENHDYRRTGFTLLKGDITKNNVKSKTNFFLDGAEGDTEQVVKPSIADIDGNGRMDVVTLVHKTSMNDYTMMYGIEHFPLKFKDHFFGSIPRSKFNAYKIKGGAIYFPPTLADIDKDGKKEIITGTRNGTVYAYKYDGAIQELWQHNLVERTAPASGRKEVRFNGGSVVTDIDLDGTQEVIIADVYEADDDWPGKVYVLNSEDGSEQTSYPINNGGAYASPSVANLDSDDNPEIVVPTLYGIKVLKYNGGSLSQECQTNDGFIWGSAVIYDVDRDNEYEIVYLTSNKSVCPDGRTCNRQLHVIDPNNNCNEESGYPISFNEVPRPTPSVANLDTDPQAEIIISFESNIPLTASNNPLGSIKAIDSSTRNEEWTYDAEGTLHPGFVSPNIADIDNNGEYNIILGENDGSTVYVLDNDGTKLFEYNVIGFMDNGIAIADIDNDKVAELAFKRAGSPETIFVSISAQNNQPIITKTENITAIAGELVQITKLESIDIDGDNLDYYYGSPFNESGQWQTNINDTGNYSVVVEVSDGNLSDHKYINVIIFNETSQEINTFSDGTSQKILDYTQAENLTVNIKIPKNAKISHSKIIIEGLA